MAKEKLFYVGIKALIRNKSDQILLMKSSLRDHGKGTKVYWDIPGGRVEKGNGVLDTLKREIEEETGITKINDPEFVTSVISHHEIPLNEEEKAGLVLMVYNVKIPENSQIRLSSEHTEFEWVSPDTAKQRLANKYPPEFSKNLK